MCIARKGKEKGAAGSILDLCTPSNTLSDAREKAKPPEYLLRILVLGADQD